MITEQQKNLWVEALRSGKYEQCFGAYRIGEKFCAMGVLFEITDNWGKKTGYDLLGMDFRFTCQYLNDGAKLSFLEIAHEVDKWWNVKQAS